MNMAPEPHRAHLEPFLSRGIPSDGSEDASHVPVPEERYLGPVEGEWLWELVGFRVRGHPWIILALMQFKRQTSNTSGHGRVSLVQHLTSPAQPQPSPEVRPPSDVVPIVPIPATEEVPAFLSRLRDEGLPPRTWLDRASIQLAFDFRGDNPSVRRRSEERRSGRKRSMRTTDGHVLDARAAALHAKLHRDFEFIALLDPVQRTPSETLHLPTLIMSRGYLAAEMSVEGGDQERREVASAGTAPGSHGRSPGPHPGPPTLFSTEYASPERLLR